MANRSQARPGGRPETTEITVDLNEADPNKAVQRQARTAPSQSDTARAARGDDDDKPHGKAEKELFKRMARFQRKIQKDFDQKFADAEARHQREISDLRKGGDRVQLERGAAEAESAHEAEIKALEAQLTAAIERGDSAEQARLTTLIARKDGAFHAKQSGSQQRRDTTAEPEARPAARAASGPTAAGSRFILANEDWWEDPAYEIEKQASSTLYLALINEEGFDPNSDDTFAEVGRRLKDKFPKLAVVAKGLAADDDDPDGEDDRDPDPEPEVRQEAPHRRRAAAANFQDRGGAPANSGKQTLTPADIKTMRDAQMDPDNNHHVVSFLREKQAYQENAR